MVIKKGYTKSIKQNYICNYIYICNFIYNKIRNKKRKRRIRLFEARYF